MGICSMSQETQTGALYQPRGVGWGGRREGGSKVKGIYVYLWLIHVEVRQKTAKFCKAIILYLEKKKKQQKTLLGNIDHRIVLAVRI